MNVKIYTSPTCPYCHMAKTYMEKNNIAYEEIDVSKNEKAALEIIKKSGHIGVPIIEIDGSYISGFDEEEIKKKLYL
jgi:glutaredoxin-like YruB-family protein